MSEEKRILSKAEADLTNQLAAAKEMNYAQRKVSGELERQNSQLRTDMQSLNDLYHAGHKEFLAAQTEVKGLSRMKSLNDSMTAQIKQLKVDLKAAIEVQASMVSERESILQQNQVEMKNIHQDKMMSVAALESTVRSLQLEIISLQDRQLMCTEDKLSTDFRSELFISRVTFVESSLKREVAALQSYIDLQQRTLVDKETDLIAITASSNDNESDHKAEKSSMLLKISEMAEITSLLKVQNDELEKDVSTLFEKVNTLNAEANDHVLEKNELLLVINNVNIEKQYLEGEKSSLLMKIADKVEQLLTADNKSSDLEQQLTDVQTQHSEALESSKREHEEALKSLAAEGVKQAAKMIALEAKLIMREKSAAQEIFGSSETSVLLRVELEKRVGELTKTISERNALEEERSSFQKRIEELEVNIKNNDMTFKSILDAERSKMQEEAKQNMMKFNQVENEKLGLLLGNKDLMTQHDVFRRDVTRLQGEVLAFNDDNTKITRMNTMLSEANSDLLKQLSSATVVQAHIEPLRQLVQDKEGKLASLTGDITTLRDALQVEREINAVLKAQNLEAEGEVIEYQKQVHIISGKLDSCVTAGDTLMGNVVALQADKLNIQNKAAKNVEELLSERDELTIKLQLSTTQVEDMIEQLRAAQQKHWNDTKRFKEDESSLLSEADSLNSELQEKTLRLVILEAEKAQIEEYAKQEISSSSQMAALVRVELEKRVDELTKTISERNALEEERGAFQKRIEELEVNIKTNQGQFQSILETDRFKMAEEVRRRMGKLKALEVEKQELLKETHDLSIQNLASEREVLTLRGEVNAAGERLKEFNMQGEMARSRNVELLEELRATARREEEMKHVIIRFEEQVKGEDFRLESVLKDVKKVAAQQILELSAQFRGMQDENEKLKNQLLDANALEKKSASEADRSRRDIDLIIQSREEIELQGSLETAGLRRDLNDQRVKVKNLSESKTAMEVDMINARMQLQKTEEELSRVRERSDAMLLKTTNAATDAESMKQIAREESRVAKSKLDDQQSKITHLENVLNKQRSEMHNIVHEYSRVERDGISDVRQLTSQLKLSDEELLELRPMVSVLRKECSDHKQRLEELQASTTSTVNSLLVELKGTEDALSGERKNAQQDVEGYRIQVLELQGLLKRAKDNIEESVSRAQTERADKEIRVHQSEGEVERFKNMLQSKESRLSDLERQHQEDRSRLLALHHKLELSERFAADLTGTATQEKEKAERLEKRLQLLQAELKELNTKNRSPRGSRTMGSLAGALLSARSEVMFSHTDSHQLYNGRESGREGRESGRDFEEGARVMDPGDYRSMRDIGTYQVERRDSFTDKYWRGDNATGPTGLTGMNGSTYTDEDGRNEENLQGSQSTQYERNLPNVSFGLDTHNIKSSSAPSGDSWHQSNHQSNPPQEYQQSPIDRVAAALASRAIKDRAGAFIPTAHPTHSSNSISHSTSDSPPKKVNNIPNNIHKGRNSDEYDDESNSATEDSIQRTEAYLRAKLNRGAPAPAARSISANSNNGMQVTQQATQQSVQYDVEDDDGDESFHLEPPDISYRPLEPSHPSSHPSHPSHRGQDVRYSRDVRDSCDVQYVRDDDADSPSDSPPGSISRRDSEKENEREWRGISVSGGKLPVISGGGGGKGTRGQEKKQNGRENGRENGSQSQGNRADGWDDRSMRR